jgi:hypothetical protein
MNTVERLKSILVSDKQQPSKKINTILKSDIFILLSTFFDIRETDIECGVCTANGEFQIKIDARARRLKNFIILD